MNTIDHPAFVHLHAYSYFSFMEGLISPSDLVNAARENGMAVLAMCDHRCLSGVVEFSQACQDAGLQPIYGLTAEVEWKDQRGEMVFLVQNQQGWSNLCNLSSKLMQESGEHRSVLRLDDLKNHHQGLIALSGGQRSILDFFVQTTQISLAKEWLKILGNIFTDGFYVEIQQHSLDQEIHARRVVDVARDSGIPMVATQSIYYLSLDQTGLQKTLSAMRENCRISDIKPENVAPKNSYFTTQQEMFNRFHWIPEAIQNTVRIASLCNWRIPSGEVHFPEVPIPPGKTVSQVLREKAESGAKKRYKQITAQIQSRLDHELEIIAARGYEPIFLIVEELLNFARQKGVPFSSRGSAASSLVAYCLEITNPEPLGLNLFFERFLNPARTSPPDIDTDLCSRRREVVIQHVFDTYGADRVSMVGTINRFRPRSALGEVAKAYGISATEIRQWVNQLPYFGFQRTSAEEKDNPFAGLKSAYPGHERIFKDAQALLKQPRHLSMHPGGVLVAPGPITDWVPLSGSASKNFTITQFDLEGVEAFGLVKIDLLGIRGLSVLGDVAEMIYSWRRTEYQHAMQVLEQIPLEDADTTERVRNGQTIGCFQIESPGMRSTLREIQAETANDIMAALALYRPGPLRGGMRDAFIRRFKKLEKVEHIHPILEPVLAETYGVILYQEQVLRIAHEVGGLSLVDADLLRRAMSHFDPGEQMKTLRARFIDGFQNRNVPMETAERIWDMMAAFAGYGFPKAHAASYARVAWQAAWCKTHFPAEFMVSVLANGGGYYSQRVYLSEVRRMGLVVHPPHINHSSYQFSVRYPQGQAVLYMGLDQVHGLTHQTQKRIKEERPFSNLNDFLSRVNPRRTEVENLIRCGGLDGFGNVPDMLNSITTGSWKKDQFSLFNWQNDSSEDWSSAERSLAQEQILGVSVDVHPLELVRDQITAVGAISTADANYHVGESVVIAGLRLSSHRARTARGELMLFLSIEDLEGMMEVVFFPQVYHQYRQILRSSGPFLIRGVVEHNPEEGDLWMRAEKVKICSPSGNKNP
ncbi:MAG: DNA polymerase III subunit alpha [Anaerolineaceae bacterium]|nr:DNA polymerase III subunit alpha [Anaerolineaceae bacterium]